MFTEHSIGGDNWYLFVMYTVRHIKFLDAHKKYQPHGVIGGRYHKVLFYPEN